MTMGKKDEGLNTKSKSIINLPQAAINNSSSNKVFSPYNGIDT
jgi:hypothetical protein